MKKFPFTLGVIALCVTAVFSPSQSNGQAIGYWRFENGTSLGLDSSGNSNDLTLAGSASALISGTVAPTNDFPQIIPQTGDTNTRRISISGTLGGAALYRADQAAFFQSSFTIEGYIRPTSEGVFGLIASQWGTNQQQWRLGLNTTGTDTLVLGLSTTGSNNVAFNIAPGDAFVGKDYYVAASVAIDPILGTTVTWYWQNLTDGGTLQSQILTSGTVTSLFRLFFILAVKLGGV